MKRLLALLALCLLVAAPVVATALNFQNPSSANSVQALASGNTTPVTVEWIGSVDGGNNSVKATYYGNTVGTSGFGITLKNPYASTYAAATYITCAGGVSACNRVAARAYDASGNVMWSSGVLTNPGAGSRFEMKVVGGTAYVFVNGVLNATSGDLGSNPAYIGFGLTNPYSAFTNIYQVWDDYVYGDTEQKYIFGLPESDDDKFIILDDFINDANDGLYNTTSGTQAEANYMYSAWGGGNASVDGPVVLENQTVNLINYDDSTVYWTGYTGSAYSGTLTIPIKTNLIDAGAPDGYYCLHRVGSPYTCDSNTILKRSLGATVTFDRDDYAANDVAHMTWEVQVGDYWDTSLYTYRVSLNDIYGVEKTGITLTERTGSFDYTFTSDDDPGVYRVQVTATPNAGGNEFWLAVDYAELSEYGVVMGYVNDHLGNTIAGANVNLSQSATYMANVTSGFDGNYTTLPFFITGTEMICNVTATGYRQHYYTILPMSTKTKTINFTLPSSSLSYTGLGIDGVAMEGFLTPGTNNIINGYGNPIPYAVINITNSTTMESYQKTATIAGYYNCTPGNLCTLVFNQTYAVEGSKTGYSNSSIYLVKPQGVLT